MEVQDAGSSSRAFKKTSTTFSEAISVPIHKNASPQDLSLKSYHGNTALKENKKRVERISNQIHLFNRQGYILSSRSR